MKILQLAMLLLLLLPLNCSRAGPRIAIYYDARYPSNWVDQGLILSYLEAAFREHGVAYVVLNADELRSFMLTESGIIVFASDVAPDTVWDGSDDSLILRWLRNGGVIIWTGDWELYYVGHADGSMSRSNAEDKLLGRQVTAAIDEGVEVRPTEAGARYLPSLTGFVTMRPFDESKLSGLEYEAYGVAELKGKRFLDPCAVRVGSGLFIKVSATLRESLGFLYIAELILNKFLSMKVKLSSDPAASFLPYAGIVYILPSGVSSPYWRDRYGDRIYFYVKSDLRKYEEQVRRDFTIISSKYSFVIVVTPLSDSATFRSNALLLDALASNYGIGVLYAIFPKWDYGPEEDYLKPGSRVYSALLSNLRFLNNLSSTLAVAVWYGWKGRGMDPEELRRFYLSLPASLRKSLWIWLDEGFVEEAEYSGVIRAIEELNATVVTELYSPAMIAKHSNTSKRQVIVTGYWNANSSAEWLEGMRRKLSVVRARERILGVWIFWDENDGSGEAYRAYVRGKLESPILKGAELSLIDGASEVDRAVALSILPSAHILPGASIVLGGPRANPRAAEVEKRGVKFGRDELIINGSAYRSYWGKLDYAIILYAEGKVFAMGTHRFGTEAALLWLRAKGLTGESTLLKWRDLNGDRRVELEEVMEIGS